MNTLGYLKQVICDEIQALKEEIKDSKILAIAFVLAVIGLLIYLKPFPDRHIYFGTYYPNSDWDILAKASEGVLNKSGLEISVINTDGALDNVVRLNDPKDKVNAAFTYGLALDPQELDGIYSLGSMVYEPVWILYNKNKIGEIKDLSELAKFKVGLGPVKSGSYQIAKKIFEVENIDIDKNPNFEPHSIIESSEKLKSGDVDAVVMVATNIDPVVQDLLHTAPHITIYDFKNAQAYARKYNSFVALTLPMDSIDINEGIPKKDINLLGTTTSLVVKKTMHPDLQLAILMAAKDASRNSTNLFFAKRDEFPAYRDPLIPISPVAERFYDYGPPHAMRYLPYWLAGFIDRAWLLILTIFAVFYPLSKLNIHFRKFRFNLKEIPHYKELLKIERRLQGAPLSAEEKEEMLKRLDEINAQAIHAGVPVCEEAAYFNFLNAIFLLKVKIHEA